MSTRSILHQAMLREWTARFADQKESGLSVSDWCQQHNFSRYQFFYWKRQLKDEVVTQSLPDIVPLTMPSAPVGSSPQVALESCASSTTFQPNPLIAEIVSEFQEGSDQGGQLLTAPCQEVR